MRETDGHNPASNEVQLRYPLPSGTRVDQYLIKEVLGAGGFGITYLAEHVGLGKLCAIKEYFPHAFSFRQGTSVRPTSASDGTYNWGLERFETEARALARFKHPAIVDVTNIFRANGTAYIVLAYESGADMSTWLKSLGRPPSQDDLDKLLRPLLSALEDIHRNNILHRDISPDNLLIRDDGRPVLIDFGSAREQIRGRARALSAIVKHGYSPPEQYTSKPELQGPWTDIYALSATIYRAITAKLPPDATERFVRDDLKPVAELARAAYRPSFMAAIDRGLRMKVEERPQSIVEWREALFLAEPLRSPTAEAAANAAGAVPASSGRSASRDAAAPRIGTGRAHGAAGRPPSERSAGGSGRPGSAPRRSALASESQRLAPSSIPKSERPDMSWIDETEAELGEPQAEAGAGSSQAVYYGILGSLGGAAGGALLSIVAASVVSPACFQDSCILRYLTAGTLAGTIAGIVFGLNYARGLSAVTEPPRSGPGN